MKERLKLVRGNVVIDSQPGRGTTIYARVPVEVRGRSHCEAQCFLKP